MKPSPVKQNIKLPITCEEEEFGITITVLPVKDGWNFKPEIKAKNPDMQVLAVLQMVINGRINMILVPMTAKAFTKNKASRKF